MIKVAILGAGDQRAGELIRLLINHPDVTISLLWESRLFGKSITDVHHGMVGEEEMRFSADPRNKKIDVAFKMRSSEAFDNYCEQLLLAGGKVIDMSNEAWQNLTVNNQLFGLSEIFRKSLVRGANRCVVARPIETISLVSLFPLAANLLLSEDINIEVEAASELLSDVETHHSAQIIEKVLVGVQHSFDKKINVVIKPSSHPRCIKMHTVIPCMLPIETIKEAYDSIYSDHNFVVASLSEYPFREVAGTNRCIVSLSKPNDKQLAITSIIDARLRGGAGESVHCLNLLFGLYEKTGLALKASEY